MAIQPPGENAAVDAAAEDAAVQMLESQGE